MNKIPATLASVAVNAILPEMRPPFVHVNTGRHLYHEYQ
jgi:hypothetical protein